MATKPTIPQGTRDFGPDVVRKRQYIFNTIRSVFELYGFQPIETPSMENIETLTGKYGDEGDKLIFRILESGDSFSKNFFENLGSYLKARYDMIDYYKHHVPGFENTENPFNNPLWEFNPEVLEFISEELLTEEFKRKYNNIKKENLPALKHNISGKALRYDLTIPFARYVAMNHGQLTFPFKRYQIQPVWRADRPQRGRYREFYQCDADVVGSNALLNEVEFVNIYNDVFQKLGLTNYTLKINSRKILTALAELCGGADKMLDITIAIDKLDKIGLEKVTEELVQRGLSNDQIDIIANYLQISGSNDEKLAAVQSLLSNSEIGKAGIAEISHVLETTTNSKRQTPNLIIDFTLARGLNYYTGIIFEAAAPPEVKIGSIGGGGRYDDLTGLFGVPNIPGAGISFGVDRIYDVLEELALFPQTIEQGAKVLFFNLGVEESTKAYTLLQELRSKGIAAEIYHEAVKMDKQFKYAEKKGIPYVVIIGTRELENDTCVVKNLATGEQQTIDSETLKDFDFAR
ncbi:MAG: histidyl-tRNA synthase [Flaviaesturariibacter sp.]|nr:histidyl-tRNA synthase [Flaviaesturariibacter sp.]